MRKKSTPEEKQALQVLHNLLGFDLEKWTVCDKPDLQNPTDSWGIEVVRDVYPKEIESKNHLKSVWDMPYSDWPVSKVKILAKNNVKLTIKDNVLHGAILGESPNSPDNTIRVIKGKVDLLNQKQYRFFQRYDLYVLVETTCIDKNYVSFVKQIIDEVAAYQQTTDVKFTKLYLAHHYVLCTCNLENQSFEHRVIPPELQEIIRLQSNSSETS